MNLAIVVPRFNFCDYIRPKQNFLRFIESLQLSVDMTDTFVVEALFPGQFADGLSAAIRVTDDSRLWLKESLINACLPNLPSKYDAVCWVDSDLLFDNSNWREQTCLALEEYPVVQAFEKIAYLGPDDEYQSGGYGTAAAGSRLGFRAPGGAIACRRELIEHGIYDRHVLGGGDEIFMEACFGRATRFCYRLNKAFSDHVNEWALKFGVHDVGYIPGTVRHLWHGDRAGRKYGFRHQLLASHDFDPETDVRLAPNGLLEWASSKPSLHSDVRDYFRDRAEDRIPASVL